MIASGGKQIRKKQTFVEIRPKFVRWGIFHPHRPVRRAFRG